MSDNSEQTQTQTEVTSSEQMVGLVPMQSEGSVGLELIGADTTEEDFFGNQAIELNGERHVIVSQAQDPETGEILLVLRGENGDHIAIQSEALSSMVQASGGEHIQVAVVSQTDETPLTLSSDMSALSPSISSSDLSTTSLAVLPSIIANIPSQTQTTTAPTNVVQAIDTPRVSQEEQPSISTTTPSVPIFDSDKTTEKPSNSMAGTSYAKESETSVEIVVEEDETSKADNNSKSGIQGTDAKTHSIKTEVKPQKSLIKDKIESKAQEETDIKEKETKCSEKSVENINVLEIEEKKSEAIGITSNSVVEEKITVPTTTALDPVITTTSEDLANEKTSEPLMSTIASEGLLMTTSSDTLVTTTASEALVTTTASEPIVTTTASEDIVTATLDPIITTTAPEVLATATATEVLVTETTSEAIMTTTASETLVTAMASEPMITTTASEALVATTVTASIDSTSEVGFGNTAVIQVQDSGNGTSLEQLMANAMLTSDGNYVFMAQTEDGQMTGLSSELNLSDVINAGTAGGQTFLIETPEGLVACTAASNEDGAIQLIPTEAGDIESAVISSAQSSGNLTENQIIQAISGGQTMSLTLTSNSSGVLELTPVSTAQNQTPAPKPGRGGRGSRTPKPKPIPTISSMGQTLLLTTETSVTDSPAVATKPSTPTSARSRGGRGRGGRGSGANNSTVNSNTNVFTNASQMKTNAKTVLPTTEAMKSTIANSLSADSSAPGPSQLAASRRTYSKKSNIVWITPEPSHGAASAAFTTVASAGVPSKPNITPKQTLTTNNSLSPKITPQSTSLSSRVRTPSPTKAIAQTVTVPLTTSSVTINKPILSTTSSTKPITPITATTIGTTIANKSTAQPTSSSKSSLMSTGSTTTKMVTASKTTAMKTTPQSSVPSKVQTPNLSIKSTSTNKTETMTKTTIRVSDITATKTSVSTPLAGKAMATKTVANVPSNTKTKSSVTKAVTPTVESPIPSVKPIISSSLGNKTTVSATTGATQPSNSIITSPKPTLSTTTITTITKPITMSSSAKLTPTPASVPEKGSKSIASKSAETSSTKPNVSTPVSVKETKTNDSTVKAVVSTPIAVKSSATIAVSSTNELNAKPVSTDSTSKVSIVPTEKTALNRIVETRHSARLSPTKTTKLETNLESNKEIVLKAKAPQTPKESDDSKVLSLNQTNEKKDLKSNLVVENEPKTISKTETNNNNNNNNNEVLTPLAQKSTETPEKPEKKLENEVQKTDSKSVRKSRRNSKNTINVEEIKKDVKSVNEIKLIETKTKEITETPKETPKEKPIETPVESVSTRRTPRKREVIANSNSAKVESLDVIATTTVVSAPTLTPTGVTKSGRVTRASSGKKPDLKPLVEEKELKTVKEMPKSEPESKVETKVSIDLEKVAENKKLESKPTSESVEPVLEKTTETVSLSRSVKKRVQFEIKEKTEEQTVGKTDEIVAKTAEPSVPAVPTRRSLRSSTPLTANKTKTDIEVNKPVVANESKPQIESNSKTPQRVSTRKRKEVSISASIEPDVTPIKSSKKAIKSITNVIKSVVIAEKNIDSTDSPSTGRLRDRKSKNIKRIEPRIPLKETIRHSIETSDPLGRLNRKKSLIQSYIDENEWQEKEDNLRRKTISSLSDLRSPNECYDYSTNECSFYIRHQSASLTPKQSAGNYLCQKCGFHTTRINNLVVHHRDQCSYIKNAVIQQWQSELQKRVKPSDAPDSASTSVPKTKRRKMEANIDSNNSFEKHFDESDDDSEEERTDELKNKNNEKLDQNPTISDIDAMLMGSDDEDLLSIDNIENPKREFGFSEDDIVWVDINNTHWPALVAKVFPKEKKVLIKLIDSPWPKKSLKTSVGLIEQFDSAEVNRKYLRDGKKTSNGDLLVKAVQKAEEFLRKKCLGTDLSSAKFFDQIDSDLSEANADEDERLTSNASIASNASNDELVSNNTKETAKTSNESFAETSLHSIGTDESDGEVLDKLPENNEAIAQWKEKRRQQNQKLLQCIKEAKVETHLLGVYRESIVSQRHQKFKSGSESEKNQLKHVPWFGPIDDEEQQEEIYDYCSQLFKTNFKTDGSFDTVAYIFEVWVPEAIVKAISRVRRIELKDSESVFAKGVILSKSEKDELTKEIQKEAEKQMSNTSSD